MTRNGAAGKGSIVNRKAAPLTGLTLLIALFALAGSAALPSVALAQNQAQEPRPVYLDPSQSVEARVNDLIRHMTLKEKIGQLNLPCAYVDNLGKTPDEKIEAARKFAAGTYTNEIGPGAGFFTLANTLRHTDPAWDANYFNELQRIAVTQTRLKIPLLEDEEGTHGAMFPGATVFPEGLAVGSTFDPALVQRVYAAAAEEARAVGIHILSTLVLELDRDPRMGRNMEAYTEDPYLDAQLARNIVEGAQGTNIAAPNHTVALVTDFPTQSEPASGMERGAIERSERSLREFDLVPWVSAFHAGALGVMAGYPEIDDVPEHASEHWNTEILRNQLGFRGVVMSEGGGFDSLIYENVAADQKQAGAMALRAGVDMDITYEPAYMAPLIESVQSGAIPEFLIDRAVRRVLELKFRLGLFDHAYVDVPRVRQIVHSPAHRQLALQLAREGIVLLKNDSNLLPLKKDLQSIAVIGPDADDGWAQLGDYSPSVIPQKLTTILDGVKAKVSPATKVLYARGCDVIGGKDEFTEAIAAARQADVAIVVVGERPDNSRRGDSPATDGEGFDVASLDLTGSQENLVRALQATGTPVVLVLVNGRPLSIPWEAEHLPAIVEAWEPGEQGGEAVADVLFGDYNPTGRLAITIPRSSGQLPVYYNHKPSEDHWINDGWTHDGGYVDMPGTPLWSFGDGLSYTTFRYTNLRIELPRSGTFPAQVTVDVTNSGQRAGTNTVQLYLHQRVAPVSLPVLQLRGFARVALDPGQTKTVSFSIRPEDLMFLDRDMLWRIAAGTVDVMIGSASDHIALRDSFEVKPTSQLVTGTTTQPDLSR
jgi:beta-glucosidase